MNGAHNPTTLLITLSLAALLNSPAEIGTRYLDEVSLPTQGVISGGLTRHGDHYVFGSDEADVPGLWITDGTALGTRQINNVQVAAYKVSAPPYLYYWVEKDLYRTDTTPSQATLIVEDFSNPLNFDDHLASGFRQAIYWLDNVSGGWELWRNLGVENEAALVARLPKGSAPSFAGLMRASDTQLVFLGPDPDSRTTALWGTDGSGSELQRLDTDVNREMRPFFCAGEVYYAKKFEGEVVLYRTNGSEGGSVRIAAEGDEPYRNPGHFLVEAGTVYFQATDRAHGTELWRIRQDEQAAVRVADLQAGNNSSSPELLAIFQESVLAMARVGGSTRLWQIPVASESTAASRVPWLPNEVKDHYIHEAIVVGDVIFLVSSPNKSSEERWLTRSDGTSSGAKAVGSTWLNQTDAVSEGWPHLYPINDAVLFPSERTSTGTEVYTWAASAADPELVRDANTTPLTGGRATILQPTSGSTDIQYFTITTKDKTELVRLRLDGTRQVLRSKEAIDFGFSLTANLVSGATFFVDRQGLWSVLPGASSPGLVLRNATARPEVSALHVPFTTTPSGIIFLASTNGISSIYHSDGFVGGNTSIIVQNRVYQGLPIQFDGNTYFVLDHATLSFQPWLLTSSNVVKRFATFPARVALLGKTGSHLYFSENSTIWAHRDGEAITSAGAPASVSPLVTPPAVDEDDRLFYIARDNAGEELWVTDGRSAGAERLTNIQAKNENGGFAHLTTVGDALFFAGREKATGFELWMSDGSSEGTVRLTDFIEGEQDSLPGENGVPMIGALGDHVYFAADDGRHGMELWRAHQSGSPIELVQDLLPGPGSSNPHNFTMINGRLFFQATDPARPMLVMREIVDRPAAISADTTIQIESTNTEVELQFGVDVREPYLLMESTDLKTWKPIAAFSGDSPNLQQVVKRNLKQPPGFYRLQSN